MGTAVICHSREGMTVKDHRIIFIPYYHFLFLYYLKPYIQIILLTGHKYDIRAPVSAVTAGMPLPLFLCNRSTIVNLHHTSIYEKVGSSHLIHSIQGNAFHLSRGNTKSFRCKCRYMNDLITESAECLSCKLAWQANKDHGCIFNCQF